MASVALISPLDESIGKKVYVTCDFCQEQIAIVNLRAHRQEDRMMIDLDIPFIHRPTTLAELKALHKRKNTEIADEVRTKCLKKVVAAKQITDAGAKNAKDSDRTSATTPDDSEYDDFVPTTAIQNLSSWYSLCKSRLEQTDRQENTPVDDAEKALESGEDEHEIPLGRGHRWEITLAAKDHPSDANIYYYKKVSIEQVKMKRSVARRKTPVVKQMAVPVPLVGSKVLFTEENSWSAVSASCTIGTSPHVSNSVAGGTFDPEIAPQFSYAVLCHGDSQSQSPAHELQPLNSLSLASRIPLAICDQLKAKGMHQGWRNEDSSPVDMGTSGYRCIAEAVCEGFQNARRCLGPSRHDNCTCVCSMVNTEADLFCVSSVGACTAFAYLVKRRDDRSDPALVVEFGQILSHNSPVDGTEARGHGLTAPSTLPSAFEPGVCIYSNSIQLSETSSALTSGSFMNCPPLTTIVALLPPRVNDVFSKAEIAEILTCLVSLELESVQERFQDMEGRSLEDVTQNRSEPQRMANYDTCVPGALQLKMEDGDTVILDQQDSTTGLSNSRQECSQLASTDCSTQDLPVPGYNQDEQTHMFEKVARSFVSLVSQYDITRQSPISAVLLFR